MTIYPCGDVTGIYYLIVSGLPWSATWQKLKDLVRDPESGGSINVDYVFIYPSSTDGWVKLCNKEDFNRAYEYLNGRVFQGKAIVADNRNGYDIVNLRDMAPVQTSGTRRETYYAQPARNSRVYTRTSGHPADTVSTATATKTKPDNYSERNKRPRPRSGHHSTRALIDIVHGRSSGNQSSHTIHCPLVVDGSNR